MTDPSVVNRDPALLAPRFREAVAAALAECQHAPTKLDAVVYEGLRSTERQAWLYAEGRTRPGKIVTNARTSLTSWHGYGLAVDVVHRTGYWAPFGSDKKANEQWFQSVAEIFKHHGCQWGGDWTKPDTPHMQWGRCTASPTAGAMALMAHQGVAAVWQSLGASKNAAPVATPSAVAEIGHPTFGSLVADGYFSSTPFDLSMRRSIRTNNPGALNVSQWQRSYPGFCDVTQPDSAGNVTSIYRTPEHGVGAWLHLIAVRYGFGLRGAITLRQLAQRYAGTSDPNAPAVRTYLDGWTGASQGSLTPDGTLVLGDDGSLLSLGKAMFHHEAGEPTPLHDAQILFGIEGEREGNLPT